MTEAERYCARFERLLQSLLLERPEHAEALRRRWRADGFGDDADRMTDEDLFLYERWDRWFRAEEAARAARHGVRPRQGDEGLIGGRCPLDISDLGRFASV